jgi:hypothetical protein
MERQLTMEQVPAAVLVQLQLEARSVKRLVLQWGQ